MPKIHWLPRELCYSHDGVRSHCHEPHSRPNLVSDNVVCVHRRHNEGNSHNGDGGDGGDNVRNKGRNSLHSPNMECRMGRTTDCRSHRNMGRNTLLTSHILHSMSHTNHTCYDSNSSLMYMDHSSKDCSNRHCSSPCMDSCSFRLSRHCCHRHQPRIVRR